MTRQPYQVQIWRTYQRSSWSLRVDWASRQKATVQRNLLNHRLDFSLQCHCKLISNWNQSDSLIVYWISRRGLSRAIKSTLVARPHPLGSFSRGYPRLFQKVVQELLLGLCLSIFVLQLIKRIPEDVIIPSTCVWSRICTADTIYTSEFVKPCPNRRCLLSMPSVGGHQPMT